MSEAMLSMVLEIEVSRHKREVAEGFAALKAKLLPPEPEPSALVAMYYNQGMALAQQNAQLFNDLSMHQASNSYANNHENPYGLQSLCGTLFMSPNGRWF